MTRLIVWRHGRTAWNADHRCQGQLDIDLDEIGLEQARAAAPPVADERPDLIVSSDLSRALSTARFLAELTGLPVKPDPRLRERDFGPWQGLIPAEITARFPGEYPRLGTATPVGVAGIETESSLAQRVAAAIRDAADVVSGGTAVLVTHGGAAQVGCGLVLGWPATSWHTLTVLNNCRFTDLRRDPDGHWRLHGHNLG
jgi:probable phosphoglycerate mutase